MDKKNEGLPVDEAGIFVMPRNSKSDSILIASGFKGTSLKKGHSPWIGKVEWVVYSR